MIHHKKIIIREVIQKIITNKFEKIRALEIRKKIHHYEIGQLYRVSEYSKILPTFPNSDLGPTRARNYLVNNDGFAFRSSVF